MRRSLIRMAAISTMTLALLWAVAGGSGNASSTSHTTVPKVSTTKAPARSGPGQQPLLVGPNANVTNKTGAQSETSVAIDPTNPKHMISASNDLTDTMHVYESFNRGRTWTEAGLSLGSTFCYDPWVAFNAVGDQFVAYECSDQRVGYKKVGQTSWTKTTLQGSALFPDRDMIALDRTATSPFYGSAYIGYDEAAAGNAAHVWYSRDGFTGWVKSPKINDSSATIGVNAAVARDGTLYATWLDYSGKKLWVDKSSDGGATWGTDHVVHNFRLNTPSFFISIPPQPDRGIVPMPFTYVAQSGTFAGRLYVTYTDTSLISSDTDTFVRYSDDGGVTWSGENKVNDDTVNAYQFHPRIVVQPNGTVAVASYDTRNDPGVNHKTDTYLSFSSDGGVTWTANQKVTTATSDESPHSGDPNDYGDYQGIDASTANWVQLSWTDSRSPGAIAEDMFSATARK